MGEAIREARAALDCGEVPVGCVYVHPVRGFLGSGHNDTVASCNATRHAELVALDRILKSGGTAAEVAECRLYVTVEPCVMCASALRQLGVRDVVYGAANDKFGGCGSVLAIHADEIPGLRELPSRGGVREEEAIALLRCFYSQENQGAPVPQKRTRKQAALGEQLAMLDSKVGGEASEAAPAAAAPVEHTTRPELCVAAFHAGSTRQKDT